MSFCQEQIMKMLSNESFQLSEPTTPKIQINEDETISLQKQLLELMQQNQKYNTQLSYIQEQIQRQDLLHQNMLKTKQRLQNQLEDQLQKNIQLDEECKQKEKEESELQHKLTSTRPKKRLYTQQSISKVISFNHTYDNEKKKNSVIVSIKNN